MPVLQVLVRRAIPAVILLCVPATFAAAATPVQQATSTAAFIPPVTVTKLRTWTLVNSLSGGTPHCAEFLGATQSSSVVNIKIPNGSVTLTRVAGTETMTVSNFTLQG